MSPNSLVHAPQVTPSPLVLEAKTSLHLSHRLGGGSRAAASALGAVTVQSARPARRAGLGWLSHSGCGQQAASAVWPTDLSGPPTCEHRRSWAECEARYCAAVLIIFQFI
jgi:hypothetical protein